MRHLLALFLVAGGMSLLGPFPSHAQLSPSRPSSLAPLPPSHNVPSSSVLPWSADSLSSLSIRSSTRPSIRWGRLAFVGGSLTAAYTGQFLFEWNRWWKGSETTFHFDSHLDYARNMDKYAHFYAANAQALLNTRALEWAGVPPHRAALWGAVISFAAQTQVEVFDGYSERWGFDAYDQVANGLGVAWFYAHERVPALRRFDVRWSYWNPSYWPHAETETGTMFADDYLGHTYWVSVRVRDLLPEGLRRYWPRVLLLSAGVSLNEWEEYPDDDAYLSSHLSVDLDWRAIIPRDSWLGRTAGDLLNRYHLPAPAVRLTPRPGVSLIFVGQ